MSTYLQLTDAEFMGAMRHKLGLTHTPAIAGAAQCWCGCQLELGDTSHMMIRKSLSGAISLRKIFSKGFSVALLAGRYLLHPWSQSYVRCKVINPLRLLTDWSDGWTSCWLSKMHSLWSML